MVCGRKRKQHKNCIEEIEIINQKIGSSQKRIESFKDKIEKLAETYVEGMISKNKMELKREELKKEKIEDENLILRYTNDLNSLQELLKSLHEQNDIWERMEIAYENLENITSDNYKQMYEIVYRFITRATVTRADDFKKNYKKIVIETISNRCLEFYGHAWYNKYDYYTVPEIQLYDEETGKFEEIRKISPKQIMRDLGKGRVRKNRIQNEE